MVGINIGAGKISELVVDADLAMGAHDITLGAGRLVDGKDISELFPIGHSSMDNRTRRIYIPISGWECVQCAVVTKGNFRTQNMSQATSRIYSSCMVPKDYHSAGQIYMVYISAGAIKLCNVNCDTPHSGENHTTGGGTGITSVPAETNNFLYTVSLGFTSLGANIAADDLIGFYMESNDLNNFYAVGYIFEYMADM